MDHLRRVFAEGGWACTFSVAEVIQRQWIVADFKHPGGKFCSDSRDVGQLHIRSANFF
jgi:hypothetical protein